MSDIIDLKKRKKPDKEVINLYNAGIDFDQVSLKYLDKGADIKDVAGIMANRLGELVRVFDGDKEALKGMIYNIIHDRAYLGEDR